MNIKHLLKAGEEELLSSGIPDYEFDAAQLLMHVLNVDFTELHLSFYKTADKKTEEEYKKLLSRRKNREPLQYILGTWSFYNSDFFVGRGVLIPRPETEELVDLCIDIIKKHSLKTVFDLCAGSGAIGISIAKACPNTAVYMFEYFDEALFYTKKNMESNALSNIRLIKCDVLSCFPENLEKPDLIVSNPPYIKTDEIPYLQREVGHEPVSALNGGEDGLDFYRAINNLWLKNLKKDGFAAVECAEDQADGICGIFSNLSVKNIHTDLEGVSRFVTGRK